MAKIKSKNHYGTFAVNHQGWKKITQNFVAALTAVIFIIGIGLLIFKHGSKSAAVVVKSDTAVVSTIPGWWLQQYFGSSVCSADNCQPDADPDGDKLTNAQEFFYHTNPINAHTVGDKLDDGSLVASGFDPSKPGHVSFDDAISQDNILGESLVFNQDVRQLINQSIDPNNVPLPQILDSDIKMTHDNSEKSIINYVTATKQVFAQDIPNNGGDYVESSVKSGDSVAISSIQMMFTKTGSDLRKIPVPDDFVQVHKYTLALLQILPDVISEPSPEALNDVNNAQGNLWYEKTQAAFSLYQKISLEESRLQTKYQQQ